MNQLARTDGALAQRQASTPAKYDEKDLALFKQTFAQENFTDQECIFAMKYCAHTGLDVFMRQVHFWKQAGKMIIHPGLDGLRALASRSGVEATRLDIMWCGPDGVWKEFWPDETTPPAAARARYYVKGSPHPATAVVAFSEFKREFYNKDSNRRELMPLWKEKPAHMLGKCADMQAIRAVFPSVSLMMERLNAEAASFKEAAGIDVRMSAEPPPEDEPAHVEILPVPSNGNGNSPDAHSAPNTGGNGNGESQHQQASLDPSDEPANAAQEPVLSLDEAQASLKNAKTTPQLDALWEEIEAAGFGTDDFSDLRRAKAQSRRRIEMR